MWILRCSIIGPEKRKDGFGLLEWFLSQDTNVDGYTNHIWNGITTLEWAKCTYELLMAIKNGERDKLMVIERDKLMVIEKDKLMANDKIIQPGTEMVHSKAEILHLLAKIWKKDIKITDIESTKSVDRSLKPTWERKLLSEQLLELHSWYYNTNIY